VVSGKRALDDTEGRNMAFRAVFFDVGGVLKTTSVSSLEPWERRFGWTKGGLEEAIYYDPACQRAMIGQGPTADIWPSVRGRFDVDDEEFEALKADYVQAMRSLSWDREMLDFIRELKPRCRTGIISNAFPGQGLEQQIEIGVFDVIVLSAEEGVAKPDAELYRRALERLGVSAADAIFVDDMLPNIEGAQAVGMHGILYTSRTDVRSEIERLLATREEAGE
jgi:HAD superfamily hydrolase (TIGR01509 family)